jgi:hypothetical protein
VNGRGIPIMDLLDEVIEPQSPGCITGNLPMNIEKLDKVRVVVVIEIKL